MKYANLEQIEHESYSCTDDDGTTHMLLIQFEVHDFNEFEIVSVNDLDAHRTVKWETLPRPERDKIERKIFEVVSKKYGKAVNQRE